MTDMPMTCGRVDEVLSDYLEDTLLAAERRAIELHLTTCLRCAALVRDLERIPVRARALASLAPSRDLWAGIGERLDREDARLAADLERIRAEAAALPALTPSRDLWAGIAERIDHEVVARPDFGVGRGGVRREGDARGSRAAAGHWSRRWLAAAALVAVTAGVTYVATRAQVEGARRAAPAVAQAPGESRDTTAPEGAGVATPSPAERRDPSLPNENGPAPERRTPSTERRLVAHERVPAAVTYDREISALRKLLEQRRNDLEPSTVAVLENSLTTIDKAIAEARAALAGDPASRFLKDQLNKALDKKLELLRTAALLPSRT